MNVKQIDFRKPKTKKGEEIHKLPPAYPVIEQYEEEFKNNYIQIVKKHFLSKLEKFLK